MASVLKSARDLIVGTVIGITAMLPGISGATMAVAFGIYERLIRDLAELRTYLIKDIRFILLVAIGLVIGTILCAKVLDDVLVTYPVFALMFTAVLCGAYLLYDRIGFIWESKGSLRRTLCVTVPEDLEYGGMFDEIMQQYTSSAVLTRIKTTNLGSLNRPGSRRQILAA